MASRVKPEVTTTEVDQSNKQSVGSDLGAQVHPDTMLTEDDGNRSLAHPAEDPGPVGAEGSPLIKHPKQSEGNLTLEAVNDPLTVKRRVSTAPDHHGDNTAEHEMHASLFASTGASDKYNPDKEEDNLGEAAIKRNAKGRDPAPLNE